MKRILICAGGTGGHIFPAIALAEELKARRSDIDFRFIGGRLETNRFFPKENYPYHSIDCSALPFLKPWQLPAASWKILRGFRESSAIIESYNPDLMVAFGSYFTFPSLLAARYSKIPYILHESNRIPGKVNRLMAPSAITTALHFPDVQIKGTKTQVAMPLRPGYHKGCVTREEAAHYYGLDPHKKTLLILGGSQGAKALNTIAEQNTLPFEQIIHLTGAHSQDTIGGKVTKGFEPNMKYAFMLADAAVCRAGASTLSELIEFELPAVLIPYPQAADNHQEANARYFAESVGGGVVLLEKTLNIASLTHALNQLHPCRERIQYYKSTQKSDTFETLITSIIDR
jgi:UDP-N-acetylglucosamine--N-acetylmuramyl-(pentapeptide) pyrophosphoryl-undecaprenol N-acetylglucosamine transferase